MKYLLCRYGGIGDTILLTVVAKAIKRQDPSHVVHLAVRDIHMEMLRSLESVDKVLELRRMPPAHTDTIKTRYGWVTLPCVFPRYDMPIDYRLSVEGNSLYRGLAPVVGEWITSQNSNFQNWVDIALSWARIDPTTVEDKTPDYRLDPEETAWALGEVGHLRPLIAMNMNASSQSRTRKNSHELVGPILEAYPDHTVLWWNNEELEWYIHNRNGMQALSKRKSTLRESVALLSVCEVFICMDSGLSHMVEGIASAIGLKTICFYTTVPGWTRAKYYPNCVAVDADLPCSPCFNLHLYCPENRRNAVAQLSDREKRIHEVTRSGSGSRLEALALELRSTTRELMEERGALENRLNTLAAVEPRCMSQITPAKVVDTLGTVLNGNGATS